MTLAGPVWVVGNFSISNSAELKVSPSLGPQSVSLIADNPVNRNTSSIIDIKNSALFTNSGNVNSYIALISMNNSAELGGSRVAIDTSNSSSGASAAVLYAPHGLVSLSNSANVREVSGYKVTLGNSSSVHYQTGLSDLLFNSGPSGGYVIQTWREAQ